MLNQLAERRSRHRGFLFWALLLAASLGTFVRITNAQAPTASLGNSVDGTGFDAVADKPPRASEKTQDAQSGALLATDPAPSSPEGEDVTETPQLAFPIPAPVEDLPQSSLERETSSGQQGDDVPSPSSETPAELEVDRGAIAGAYAVELDAAPFRLSIFGDSFNPWWQANGLKLRFGIFNVRLSLGLVTEYSDNIFYSSTNRTSDVITSLTASLLVGAGDWIDRVSNFVLLEYSPALQFYAQHSAQNNTPQSLVFTSQFGTGRLVNKFRILYTLTNSPTADQVGLHEYQTLDAALVSSYSLGGRTVLQNTGRMIYQDDYVGISYLTFSTAPRLDYTLHDKLALFLEPYAGIVFTEGGPTQQFEGLNLGFKYSTLSKLKVEGSLGFETYQTGGAADEVGRFITPTFGLVFTYEIRQTAIILDLNREVRHSGFVDGQTYINNALSLIVKQRIFGKIDIRLDLQYQILEYRGLGENNRTDTFLLAVPRIDYLFWNDQATLSIYYRVQLRGSEIPSNAYSANTIGAAIRWNF
ncbi:MAG: hypothetical protein WAM53_15875 [Terrimicrobiaceae bacterium]